MLAHTKMASHLLSKSQNETYFASAFVLDFPASKTGRKKNLLCKPLVCGCYSIPKELR